MKLFACLLAVLLCPSQGYADFVLLHNGGPSATTTGDNLHGISAGSTPVTVAVEEVPGLMLTVTNISSTGTLFSSELGLGVDSTSDSFADQFENIIPETITFQFNQPVVVDGLEFSFVDPGDEFVFFGVSISVPASGQFSFSSPLDIPSATNITVRAQGDGPVGLRSINLTAVPEPSGGIILCAFAGLATTVRRRRMV